MQASQQLLDSRSKYYGVYFQDSWRASRNLTLNYGLRWEVATPWYDTQNKLETVVLGEQSLSFPGAPLGLVVPGDPGIPRTLGPTKYTNFAPRIGFAYAPEVSDGFLGKILGGPGKTSIVPVTASSIARSRTPLDSSRWATLLTATTILGRNH